MGRPMKCATHASVRCTAHSSRTGQPCKRWATTGSSVCRTHGAAAPQVKAAASERLAALVDPAITALHGLLSADDEKARLGAVRDVLDRNGFKPVDRIDVKAQVNYANLSDAELEARIAELV
jgi:hypothetical protein